MTRKGLISSLDEIKRDLLFKHQDLERIISELDSISDDINSNKELIEEILNLLENGDD